MSEWRVIFVLPNLRLEKPIENEHLALVPRTDERLQPLIATRAVAVLLDRFTDAFGRRVQPAALIARNDAPPSVNRDAIVGFRNLVALATIMYGWASVLRESQVHPPIWSDTFSLYPIFPRSDGYLGASTPALAMIDTVEEFAGQASPILTRNIVEPVFDHALFSKLNAKWESCYIASSQDHSVTRLFRSLQTAFAACTVPYDNGALLSDFGVRVGQWASAFEILAHPGTNVGLREVVEMLNGYGSLSGSLNARGNMTWKGKQIQVNAPARLYAQLAKVRNAFVHGNPLTDDVIYVGCDRKKPAWNAVAPLLYWCALRSHLGMPASDASASNSMQEHLDQHTLDGALQVVSSWGTPG